MAKTKRKSGRPKAGPAAIVVYCTEEEKAALERAAAKLVETIPGAKMPVYRFLLNAALEKARGLGVWK